MRPNLSKRTLTFNRRPGFFPGVNNKKPATLVFPPKYGPNATTRPIKYDFKGGLAASAVQAGLQYMSDAQYRNSVNNSVSMVKKNGLALYNSAKNAFRRGSESLQDGKRTVTSPSKMMHLPILSISGQITSSTYKDGRPEPKFYKKLVSTGASLSFENNVSTRQTSVSASQNTYSQGFNAIPQLIFYNNAVSNQISTPPANSQFQYNTQWFLRNTKVKMTLTNAGLNGIDIKICEVVRRDDQVGLVGDGVASNTNPWQALLNGPATYWKECSTYENQSGYTTPTQLTPGNLPTQYRSWNRYFKIVKCFPVTLQAGASHIHTSMYSPYSSIGGSLLFPFIFQPSAGLYNGGYAGLTRYLMVIFNGMPVHSNAAGGESTVSLGQSALNIIYSTNSTIDFYNYSGKTSVISNGLPTIPAGNEQVWTVNNPSDVPNNIM